MAENELSTGMFDPPSDVVDTFVNHEPAIGFGGMTTNFIPGELPPGIVVAENQCTGCRYH